MTGPCTRWQPNLGAAVEALAAAAQIDLADLSDHSTIRPMMEDDARTVLDASGANAEIERLRAVLHASQHVLAELRDENTHLLSLALALTLEPVIAEPTNDEPELAQ